MNVVLLVRVSTSQQDYQRQVTELTQFCQAQGWNISNIFANKVSGAKKMEERIEILEMIEFVQHNKVDKVVVLEISRLGRNTLEALKVIQTLNEQGICLYVKNYNLETIIDGKVNPVASLICTILLEIASMERLTRLKEISSSSLILSLSNTAFFRSFWLYPGHNFMPFILNIVRQPLIILINEMLCTFVTKLNS